MNRNIFILTSDECELLVAFESAPSLEKLSEQVGRDISSVSRALSRMASKIAVIEKQSARWVLTEQGRVLNQHTRDSIAFQRTLFQKQTGIRIGTNREFAARILGKQLSSLQDLFPESQIRIMAFEAGTEQALLDGKIDLSIDCERPFSPDVSYKIAIKEPIIAVCNPKFKKAHSKELNDGNFFGLPHLLCDRLPPDRILLKSDNKLNVSASFNDIATTRSACETGLGWALLPTYAVKDELENGSLVKIQALDGGESIYGVWWLRGRKQMEPMALRLHAWLKKIDL
ncbi:MAG: LysR family transcriptional regulator [Pseudobdellovibrionaceae bacterium]